MNLKYVSYNGSTGLTPEKNAQNCVDSLIIDSSIFYFIKIIMGYNFFVIAQTLTNDHKSYIAFGYFVSLSYQSKTQGKWNTLKSLT